MSAEPEAREVGGSIGLVPDPVGLEPIGAEAIATRFARAMLSRDPRLAAGCFAPGASILTADGTAIVGRPGVTAVLQQIATGTTELKIRIGRTILCEDTAVCTQFWLRSTVLERGEPHRSISVARLVLRQRRGWEIVIANPWEKSA